MGAQSREIAEAIRALSGFDDLQFEAVICTASNVRSNELLCDCKPINGNADFIDVRLNANKKKGFVLVPKENSIVIINQISNEEAYISMVSDVDEVLLAGDDNGGLIKVTEQTAKLNQLIAEITANFSAISALYPYTVVPLTTLNETDFTNTKVKHGNG